MSERYRVWCLSWDDTEEDGRDVVAHDPALGAPPRGCIALSSASLDMETAAEAYAWYIHDNRNGHEVHWPLKFRVRAASGTEDFEVRRCFAVTSPVDRIAQLEAENADLREHIAASKEVADARIVAEVNAENERLRQACRDALAALREGRPVRSAWCQYCGEGRLTPDGETADEAFRISAEHARQCEKNPLVAEVRALRGAVIEIHDLQLRRHEDAEYAWAIRETANDLSAPFSDEAVERRLVEMRSGR